MATEGMFNGERLKKELTNPKFFGDLTTLVGKSRDDGLVGRFSINYSQSDDQFYASPVVNYYSVIDLQEDQLDYDENHQPHFMGAKLSSLYPRLDFTSDLGNDGLVAVVYTLPKLGVGYDGPPVQAFHLADLACMRMGTNIKAGNSGREHVFRPFGISVESLYDPDGGTNLHLNFYSEVCPEPYLLSLRRGGNQLSFKEISARQDSIEAILVSVFGEILPYHNHAFFRAWYSLDEQKFEKPVDPDFFEKLVYWDKADLVISKMRGLEDN